VGWDILWLFGVLRIRTTQYFIVGLELFCFTQQPFFFVITKTMGKSEIGGQTIISKL